MALSAPGYKDHTSYPSASHILILFLLVLHTCAEPFTKSTLFDSGFLGAYPYESFHTTDLVAPRLNIRQWDSQCDHGLILFTPRANSVPDDGPMILDAKGNLIWTDKSFGTADNLQIQQYKGESYLTFWAGRHDVTRWPGKYYLLDSNYEVKYVVTPVGFEFGDLHEFTILENGTALMTIYDALPWDLSPIGGPVHGWIEDSVFQEIDLETGDLIFEWRASDHYNPNETFAPIEGFGTSEDNAFDYIHINSIDKDEKGNYFISGRLTCDIAYIDGKTGDLLWTLGGRRSAFKDLSQGAASNFTYQHHMRYHGLDEEDESEDSIVISIFDNSKFQRHHPVAWESRGLLISLNLDAQTATLIQDFKNPLRTLSHSQGSMQVLISENVTARQSNTLVGWGHSAAWTMFNPSGGVLCDVHYGAYATWNLGWAVSYRVFLFDEDAWTGMPKKRPEIAPGLTLQDASTIYASWNGATAVRKWRLQGASSWTPELDGDAGAWTDVAEQPKGGFEVAFKLDDDDGHEHHMRQMRRHGGEESGPSFRYYRVQALGTDDEVLAFTRPVDPHSKEVLGLSSSHPKAEVTDSTISPILLACVAFSVALIASMFCLRR